MSLVRQERFAEAFNKSNLRLCEKYRLPAIQLTRRDRLSATAGFSMDDIFGLDISAVATALNLHRDNKG
jgi:hypothetical protein